MNCRQTPHGTINPSCLSLSISHPKIDRSIYLTIAIALKETEPSLMAFTNAVRSAQIPAPYEQFSTLHPARQWAHMAKDTGKDAPIFGKQCGTDTKTTVGRMRILHCIPCRLYQPLRCVLCQWTALLWGWNAVLHCVFEIAPVGSAAFDF
jgi:hypothetical protein